MVQDENAVNDGADEQMLGTQQDTEKLAQKRDEVKFIKGEGGVNGDAKIDIGDVSNGKAFTGMTKDELMKFANDPFWVRLRWIFFIAFWAIWVGMLVGAILIIIDAPKCAAPVPLPWYKRGPLGKFDTLEPHADDVQAAKKLHATGAIYELPAQLTYLVKEAEVEDKLKNLVAAYKDSGIDVILDITPNYVPKESVFMRDALANKTKRSAFIWIEKPEVPNNWLSIVNGSAWTEVETGNFVLSQFGDGLYDLHMNDTIVKEALSDVFKHLIALGVLGIRLKNTKFFLLTKSLEEEEVANDPKYTLHQYGFWLHTHTTFQEGLGDLLDEYRTVVKLGDPEAFLSVAEDVIRPEVYQISSSDDGSSNYGIDMPMYGRFVHSLRAPEGKQLDSELVNIRQTVGNDTWLQWSLTDVTADDQTPPSSLLLFMCLLSGVPVLPVDSPAFRDIPDSTYKHIGALRMSASFMHGEFQLYASNDLVAYARIKSGNPGYFVILNPTDTIQQGNFSTAALPEKMTVDAISENYNVTDITVKSKVAIAELVVSPHATVVLTYVPVKSG